MTAASLGAVLRRYAAALQCVLDASVPSVGYGRDLLVVSFHRRQIDGGPFFKVPIALDALGVSKGLAVGLVNLVDARYDLLEIGDILVGRLDVLEETLCRDPVFPERMATRLETVARSLGLRKVFDDVLEVKLHSVAEIEADRVYDKVDVIPPVAFWSRQNSLWHNRKGRMDRRCYRHRRSTGQSRCV